ncbi:MAG: hypothetical protein WCJ71_05770 [Candidatus Omnitrophota bacterium]
MALEGNRYDWYAFKLNNMTPAARRVCFRFYDKFRIDFSRIKEVLLYFYPASDPVVLVGTMKMEEIFCMYLKRLNNISISTEEAKNLIQVLDFDDRRTLSSLTKERVAELLYPPPMPTDKDSANLVARHDWRRGYELGEKLFHASEWLIKYALQKKQKLVVYGRDAEIVYDVINYLQIGKKEAANVVYIVLSRNQLQLMEAIRIHPKADKRAVFNVVYDDVHGHSTSVNVIKSEYEEYLAYIKAAIDSPDVINVDTGVAGSVQNGIFRFLWKMGDKRFGNASPDIKMLCSSFHQIPVEKLEGVVDQIEHKEQTRIKAFNMRLPKHNPAAFRYVAFRIGVIDRIKEMEKKRKEMNSVVPYTSGTSTVWNCDFSQMKITIPNSSVKKYNFAADLAVNSLMNEVDPDEIPF